MDSIVIQQNPHWDGVPYDIFMPRVAFEQLVAKTAIEEILVLMGIRRSGKSTLFQHIINHLINEQDAKTILYINFDDPFFIDIYDDPKSIYTIVETAEKLTGIKVQYLFLDEVQNVLGWERYVKSVYDSKIYKKIFVTGSNSKLLTGEYASLLTGRYIKHRVYPLSYQEIVNFNDVNTMIQLINQKPKMLAVVDNIMKYGSYPKVYLTKNAGIKRDLLIDYYESIIYKDCIKNYEIRNIKTFTELAHYLLSNPGCIFSYNKLAQTFGCSDNTIKDFVGILEQSFLVKQINHLSLSVHKQTKGPKKCYIADNGFVAANAFQFIDVSPRMLENLVFTELQKQFGNKVYFYNDQYECDFIAQSEFDFTAVQVCYKLTEKNREREIRGLRSAQEKIKCNKKVIITYDQEENIDGDINVVPFWKYFASLGKKQKLS